MEVLYRVWYRSERVRREPSLRQSRPRSAGPFLCVSFAIAIGVVGCESPAPELVPDEVLKNELGLGPRDRVHTIVLTGGTSEHGEPGSASVLPGDFVQFVSGDWLIHEIGFEVDSLTTASRDFLERTAQMASPPLLQKGSRFVLSFVDAPPGRYSYLLEGNTASERGVIVVLGEERR